MGSSASSAPAPAPSLAARPSTAGGKPSREAKSLQKGQQTRAAILDDALSLASQMGLEGLSIGALAEVTKMSKSGVFAHFGSREELQISVIREYHRRFKDEVFTPALREPRGMPRLRALLEAWFKRVSVEVHSGCIYISGAVEFDDRPGPVRDALVDMVKSWHDALLHAMKLAVDAGHLDPANDTLQMLFELHGLILSLHHDARFMRTPGSVERAHLALVRTLTHYATPAGLARMGTPPAAVARKASAAPAG